MQLSQILVDATQEREELSRKEEERSFLNAFLTDIDLYAAEKKLYYSI